MKHRKWGRELKGQAAVPQSHQNLELLAEQDPVSRPLALLQLEALRAANDSVWDDVTPVVPEGSGDGVTPALMGKELTVDVRNVTDLLERMTDLLVEGDIIRLEQRERILSTIDPLNLLKSAIEWDADSLAQLADDVEMDVSVLGTLGHCGVIPIMLAYGRNGTLADSESAWKPGYCPVCGSWPLLAEQRGLDKKQWLRCGRCSAAWRSRHQRCVYCDNTEHGKLGYMAPEAERESRRAVTCQNCEGYLKVFSTVAPLPIADVLRQDLQSVELDIAAMDGGYSRPDGPGFPLEVSLIPAKRSTGRWFPWT